MVGFFKLNYLTSEMADVSVVVPCYRCSNSIERAVRSIAVQSVPPREVILVDDASGDGTLATLHELARLHPKWVKVIELNENIGAAGARNAGWNVASRPYIAFLDADDTWHSDKIRIQYQYMRDNPDVAISGHQCIVLRDVESPLGVIFPPIVIRVTAQSLIFRNSFSTPTVMLKRNIPFRFSEDKRYCEDFFLWQQIAYSGLLISRLEAPMAYVHKALFGEGGLSAQLWEMEKGELDNFARLYGAGSINKMMFLAASLFSILKFCKRVILASTCKISALLRQGKIFL